MPTWPSATVIPPYSVSPFGLLDPTLRFESDQGYSVRRPRHSRSRRTYQVVYWDNAHLILQLMHFIENDIRGGTMSFTWTYPYPQRIQSINNATPNMVHTLYVHGLQTGDQVVVSGTATHNGTYTVQFVNMNNFFLQGTSGGVAEGAGGLVSAHYPYMALQLEGDTLAIPEIQHGFGPFRDQDSLTKLTLLFREEFA